MGIKVKEGEYCEWDNPVFPEGKTPKQFYVSFSGIQKRWPAADFPEQRRFTLTQIDAYTWIGYNSGDGVIELIITADLISIYYHFEGLEWFYSESEKVMNYNFDGRPYDPWLSYWGGHCQLSFLAHVDDTDSINYIGNLMGVPTTPKLFSEPILSTSGTICNRYANTRDKTKIYIRKEV